MCILALILHVLSLGVFALNLNPHLFTSFIVKWIVARDEQVAEVLDSELSTSYISSTPPPPTDRRMRVPPG